MLPPGTAARAAALTLSAVSPVSSVSVMPLAMWPPLVGSKLPRSGGGVGLVDDAAGVVVEVLLSAVADPLMRRAPRPPRTRVDATSTPPTRALRTGFMGWVLS